MTIRIECKGFSDKWVDMGYKPKSIKQAERFVDTEKGLDEKTPRQSYRYRIIGVDLLGAKLVFREFPK